MRTIPLTLLAGAALTIAAPAFAEPPGFTVPFGGYHRGGRCGMYGARARIMSADEARKVIEQFIAGQELQIGALIERPRFFRAELLDRERIVRDVVIVDKSTGRIRSAY